jgi:hypothetical protein
VDLAARPGALELRYRFFQAGLLPWVLPCAMVVAYPGFWPVLVMVLVMTAVRALIAYFQLQDLPENVARMTTALLARPRIEDLTSEASPQTEECTPAQARRQRPLDI